MAVNVTREEVLLDLTRKNGVHLRLVLQKGATEEGQIVAWYAIELGSPEGAEFKAKDRVVVRSRELHDLLVAMHRAYFGHLPPGAKVPPELDLPVDLEPDETPF